MTGRSRHRDRVTFAAIASASGLRTVSLYPVPPAGDPDLDANLAPYAGAKGALELDYLLCTANALDEACALLTVAG